MNNNLNDINKLKRQRNIAIALATSITTGCALQIMGTPNIDVTSQIVIALAGSISGLSTYDFIDNTEKINELKQNQNSETSEEIKKLNGNRLFEASIAGLWALNATMNIMQNDEYLETLLKSIALGVEGFSVGLNLGTIGSYTDKISELKKKL